MAFVYMLRAADESTHTDDDGVIRLLIADRFMA
jgi:hypothetical protein